MYPNCSIWVWKSSKAIIDTDININDEILITAFGREKNIINSLEKINIKYKKIISIENLFPYNTFKFANNITKLLYNIDSLNRLTIEKKYKLFISVISNSPREDGLIFFAIPTTLLK